MCRKKINRELHGFNLISHERAVLSKKKKKKRLCYLIQKGNETEGNQAALELK